MGERVRNITAKRREAEEERKKGPGEDIYMMNLNMTDLKRQAFALVATTLKIGGRLIVLPFSFVE